MKSLRQAINVFAEDAFGVDNLIRNISNYQIFLDYGKIATAGLEPGTVEKNLKDFLIGYETVDKVFTRNQMEGPTYEHGLGRPAQLGFNQERSGDLLFILDPGTIAYKTTGSTHGSGLSYDTHVPLLFYGKGIRRAVAANLRRLSISPLLSPAFWGYPSPA